MALILVVDDDPRIRRLLCEVLGANGFAVLEADDGDRVLDLVRGRRPHALVLDLIMPRVSGLEALQAVRAAGEDLPILVLTGAAEEDHILAAFESGADDYVTKPFQPRVLVARLTALLRRRTTLVLDSAQAGGRFGEVALDPLTHRASVDGRSVALSPTEYQLLRVLIRDAGRVFTTNDLLASVWGPAYVGDDDIVRSNIYRLRQKLEPRPEQPRYILGRRGVGYFFATTERA